MASLPIRLSMIRSTHESFCGFGDVQALGRE
jgi:hypothetical protein